MLPSATCKRYIATQSLIAAVKCLSRQSWLESMQKPNPQVDQHQRLTCNELERPLCTDQAKAGLNAIVANNVQLLSEGLARSKL